MTLRLHVICIVLCSKVVMPFSKTPTLNAKPNPNFGSKMIIAAFDDELFSLMRARGIPTYNYSGALPQATHLDDHYVSLCINAARPCVNDSGVLPQELLGMLR